MILDGFSACFLCFDLNIVIWVTSTKGKDDIGVVCELVSWVVQEQKLQERNIRRSPGKSRYPMELAYRETIGSVEKLPSCTHCSKADLLSSCLQRISKDFTCFKLFPLFPTVSWSLLVRMRKEKLNLLQVTKELDDSITYVPDLANCKSTVG